MVTCCRSLLIVSRRAYRRPSQITRFRWPVVMSCAFGCTLVRSILPDMVSVSSQSFPSPFLRGCLCVCFVYLGCGEQNHTCSYVLYECAPSCFGCYGPNYTSSRARLNTMFCVSCFSSPAPPTSTYRITAWRPGERRVGRRRCPLHYHRTPR